MPRVLNRHTDEIPPDAKYVGRGTPGGNPYHIGRDGDRTEVIRKFKLNVLPKLARAYLESLRGHDLVCSCAPRACHGDVLLEAANTEEERLL